MSRLRWKRSSVILSLNCDFQNSVTTLTKHNIHLLLDLAAGLQPNVIDLLLAYVACTLTSVVHLPVLYKRREDTFKIMTSTSVLLYASFIHEMNM